MRIVRRLLAVPLAILLVAPAAHAQSHVIDKSALAKAVANRVSQDRADREAILSLLNQDAVKTIAARAGLSVERAASAVSMLHGDDLRDLAAQARQAQNDLAGGASNIVISTTTIIIVLLIIILIVLIAD